MVQREIILVLVFNFDSRLIENRFTFDDNGFAIVSFTNYGLDNKETVEGIGRVGGIILKGRRVIGKDR